MHELRARGRMSLSARGHQRDANGAGGLPFDGTSLPELVTSILKVGQHTNLARD
jgi:hypothetical protein